MMCCDSNARLDSRTKQIVASFGPRFRIFRTLAMCLRTSACVDFTSFVRSWSSPRTCGQRGGVQGVECGCGFESWCLGRH